MNKIGVSLAKGVLAAYFVAAITYHGGATAHAQTPPKMKMTTPIPQAITTPPTPSRRVSAHSNSSDGFPDDATVQKVYDNLDFQRGVQAFMTGLPGASLVAMRTGLALVGCQ